MSEEEKKAIKIVKGLAVYYDDYSVLDEEEIEENNNVNNSIQLVTSLIEKQQKEIKELKEKYDKDTHTLQNQLDIANADIAEKDKIIDLMANFMNKRSWKEHQVKDDICFCCKIEYSSEECVNCIKQYFEKKAEEAE